MSFPSLPLFHSQNKHTSSTNARTLIASASTSNTRLNPYSHSQTATVLSSANRGIPNPTKPRQKSKSQPRPKPHNAHTADPRSKLKPKLDSKPKGSSSNNLRMRTMRGVLPEASDPDATTTISDTRSPDLESQLATVGEDLKRGEHTQDDTEDEETEGEAEADRDTEAEADTSVDVEPTHRTSTVDPFSAEEERIITVLSRKLEQLREYETTSITTSPLSPVDPSSPIVPLPLSPPPDSKASAKHPAPIAASVAANNDKASLGANSLPASKSLAAGKEKTPLHKHTQKRISPPPISTTLPPTLNVAAYPTSHVSLHEYTHSRPSSADSGIYASSPSPTPSSPSSVYAAGAASPINYRNGSAGANGNGKPKNNGHAVPIAVNGSINGNGNGHGKGKGHLHHDDSSGVGDGIPLEFNNTYSRNAHVSTLSSPEMSLSASPCEAYDMRWMGTKVNCNGIAFGNLNGNLSSFDSNSVNEMARMAGSQNTRESESQTAQTQLMLHALMQENEQLKSRIVNMEDNYMRLSRLNEVYREELIGYRRRLGLPVDNLIGLASDPLPSSHSHPRFASTSTHTHPQGPHTYHHQHQPPTSPLRTAFNHNSSTSYIGHNNINSNMNGRVRAGSSYVPNRSDYAANGSGYGHGPNGVASVRFGTTSANNASSSRITSAMGSTNGVPIPRPPSQVHTNRNKEMSMMTVPMSVPSTDEGLLHMHVPTSRGVNEPQALLSSSVPSPTYPSPPYSGNSSSFFSGPYSSSYSAASSSAASSSAASSGSASTNVTSPASSLSLTMMMMLPPTLGVPSRGLSYPLVPPPSLSSSLGSGGSPVE